MVEVVVLVKTMTFSIIFCNYSFEDGNDESNDANYDKMIKRKTIGEAS